MKINCLVVDDEHPAREIMKTHISNVDWLILAGTCSNAIEALAFLQKNPVDLLFLDIQMPRLLGTDFLRTLNKPPKVIFTTAHRKFAVEGFDLDAVDYLLKPISFERFLKSVNKVLRLPENQPETEMRLQLKDAPEPFLYFRADRQMVKILLSDILFVEGMKDYVRINTSTRPVITKHLLSGLESLLPALEFVRIHRSFIVAMRHVEKYGNNYVQVAGKELPVGRLFKHEFMKRLNDVSVKAIRENHGRNNVLPA